MRLKDLREKYNRRIRSKQNARENGVFIDNSNRKKWVQEDIKHIKINDNLRRHRLLAKYLKVPEISDALNHRADHLQEKSNKLQKQKDKLKQTGIEDLDSYGHNVKDENDRYYIFNKKEGKCQKIIAKNAKYSSFNTQNQCPIL